MNFIYSLILTLIIGLFSSLTHPWVMAQDILPGKHPDELLVYTDHEQNIQLHLLIDQEKAALVEKKMLKAKELSGGIRQFYQYIWPPELDLTELTDEFIEGELIKKPHAAFAKTKDSFTNLQAQKKFSYLTFLIHDLKDAAKANEPVGTITLHRDLDESTGEYHTSIGISIFPLNHGGGIGQRSSQALVHLVHETLSENELYWDCYAANIPSTKIAERIGFKLYKEVEEAMGKALYYKLKLQRD